MENLPSTHKKKPVTNKSLQQAPPLRHIGRIVIWEGNYRPDIFNIGIVFINLNMEEGAYLTIIRLFHRLKQ